MRVLCACEESQRVCVSFRELGHDAYSCDIIECSGEYPEFHIQDDVLNHLDNWDLIIAFPPCTYLTVTGNDWYNTDKYGLKAVKRIENRKKAIEFFLALANAPCEKIAIENPVGVMSSIYRKPDQIIRPFMFGEPYEKNTCLWLKNLPPLKATKFVEVPGRLHFSSGRNMPKWYAESWCLPKEERAKFRSKTFWGIARAMAQQWGKEE